MAGARLSIEKWRRLIEEYERSGEPQSSFVARKRLKLTTFQKRLYQIRREGEASAAFVEVSRAEASDIVVEHGGVRIRFGGGVAAARVAEIVSALHRC